MIGRHLVIADSVVVPGSNGRARPDANAVLIEDCLVVRAGTAAELSGEARTEHVFAGAVVVPGLRDAHLHPVAYAAAARGPTLDGIESLEELKAVLRAEAARSPTGQPIIALRFNPESLAVPSMPTRQEIDLAVADRPVVVHRYCGHIASVNTAALTISNTDATTPDPPGGVIDRDIQGTPTGVLRETAIELVTGHLAGAAAIEPGELVSAMHGLAALGITSIGAMLRMGSGPWASIGNELEIVAAAANDLPIRLHAFVVADTEDELTEAREMLSRVSTTVRWAGIKRFADGSLGGHTAAMFQPFTDHPGTGMMRLTPHDKRLAVASLDAGGAVAIHAIGDKACAEVIEFYGGLVAGGVAASRLRIEHASVLRSQDITRLGRLGVVASVQPAFLGSERDWLERRVGVERLAFTYPFASLARAGATLAGGSDSPVESPDPWAGIALARDRAGVTPNERLSSNAAFSMFTAGGAAALGEPSPLAPGSPADLVVVDRDPLTATPDELRTTKVIATWVGGRPVATSQAAPAWRGSESVL